MRVISARTTGTQIPAAEEPPRRATAPIRSGFFFSLAGSRGLPSLPLQPIRFSRLCRVRSADKGGSEQADHAWFGAGVGGFTEATHALDTGESVGGSSEASQTHSWRRSLFRPGSGSGWLGFVLCSASASTCWLVHDAQCSAVQERVHADAKDTQKRCLFRSARCSFPGFQ